MSTKFKVGDEIIVLDIELEGKVTGVYTLGQYKNYIHTKNTTYEVKCLGEPTMKFKEGQLMLKKDFISDPAMDSFLLAIQLEGFDTQIDLCLREGDKERFLYYSNARNDLLEGTVVEPMKLRKGARSNVLD